MPQSPDENEINQLYYRLPDVADVYVSWEGKKIHHKRMNIFQLGALVSETIR
jgi:hypothetical protein